uniref:C-type lectin domain-containing protein n=1 Tax=Sus scrofa TaxID=9823 RepID=A0A8D1CJH8_PIG
MPIQPYSLLQDKAKTKLPLLLALLFGTVSAFHLRTEMSNMESPLGDDALPQVGEMPEREAKEELMLLEKEEEQGSGREDAPREEGSVESLSALDEVAEDLKCPGEEDTVKLQGTPGGKICLCLLVRSTLNFNLAQVGGQWPWPKSRVQCLVRGMNQGPLWIGVQIVSWGHHIQFHWVDDSAWSFVYWAADPPWSNTGGCWSLFTPPTSCCAFPGGHWILCSY